LRVFQVLAANAGEKIPRQRYSLSGVLEKVGRMRPQAQLMEAWKSGGRVSAILEPNASEVF